MELKASTGVEPQSLRDRPKLAPHLHYYKQVFIELRQSRAYTQFGQPLPIPLTEYAAYFDIYDIKSLSEREAILRNVRIMDGAYVKVTGEKIKAESDKQTKSAVA